MTLDELSNAWTALRNAALGRSVAPPVPNELAELVQRRYDAFKKWLGGSGVLVQADVLTSVTGREWVREYRHLLGRVEKAGQRPSVVLPLTPVETMVEVSHKLERSLAWGLFGTGVGVALFVLGRIISGDRD